MRLLVSLVAVMVSSGAGKPTVEQARSLIPWEGIDPKIRPVLEEAVNHPTVYHRTRAEVFACNPELYLLLLHQPVLTTELWKATGLEVDVKEIAPDRYRGSDGTTSSGQWEFVYKSPELNVIYLESQYRGRLFYGTLKTRSVLILRSVFFRETDGRSYVKHQLDGFVKAESGSLGPLAATFHPIFGRSVQITMQQALWFLSLMCRYSVYDPHSVARVVEQTDKIPHEVKGRARSLLAPFLAVTPERQSLLPARY